MPDKEQNQLAGSSYGKVKAQKELPIDPID